MQKHRLTLLQFLIRYMKSHSSCILGLILRHDPSIGWLALDILHKYSYWAYRFRSGFTDTFWHFQKRLSHDIRRHESEATIFVPTQYAHGLWLFLFDDFSLWKILSLC